MTAGDIHQFLSVFLATLPLVGVIGWAAFVQERRLARIESQLDSLGQRLEGLGMRVNDHDVRIARVETRLDNPRLVTK